MQRSYHYIYEDWINRKGIILNDLEPVGLHKSSSYQGLIFHLNILMQTQPKYSPKHSLKHPGHLVL